MGHNWKAIVSQCFPGRTALQARNQYNQFCRRTGVDTQPSTPGSMQSTTTPLVTNRSFSCISPTQMKSRRQQQQQEPLTDTHLEDESNDNLSSEDGDEDDHYDPNWSQSDKWPQWDPAREINSMQARQSPLPQFDMPSVEIEPLSSPLTTDGMLPLSSLEHSVPEQALFQRRGVQALEASDILYKGAQVEIAIMICENLITESYYLGLKSKYAAIAAPLDQLSR